MKPSLQLKLSQHLALTPQLQQSIRLLQLSTIELEHELEKYLLDNPLLERAEEYPSLGAQQSDTSGDGSPEPNTADEQRESSSPEDEGWLDGQVTSFGSFASPEDDDGDSDYQDVQAATVSLREHLLWQLGLMTIPDRDRVLVRCLVEALDDGWSLVLSFVELAEALQ